MTAISLIFFFLCLMLVGGSIRFAQFQWPDNALVQAIGVIY